jgi:hypothetical protein
MSDEVSRDGHDPLDFVMSEAGPSGVNDEPPAHSPPPPAPSISSGDADQYGLSNLRRSGRIAACVERIGRQQWGRNHVRRFIVDETDEEDNAEEEDHVDAMMEDEDWVEHFEEDIDDYDLSCAEPGQEGISAWDLLGESFLKEASQLGMSTSILSLWYLMTILIGGRILDESDLTLLRSYALKLNGGLTDSAFDKLRWAFPQAPVESLKNTEKRVQSLSGFLPVNYHCCPNSCVCYTNQYETLTKCPSCNTDRYEADGTTPRASFAYLPLIPRIRAMLANPHHARKMQYRSQRVRDPMKVSDIFDGTHYCLLQETFVTIDDEELPTWFFSDPRDIALGLSTDGFGPFKRRTKTAWPIILFNYNLPPEERFLKQNIISIGVIPGPKKPGDFDSFIFPLVQELLQLEMGVSAFDALTQTVFLLHAYLIVVFGDIPAVSMIMRMKGHNGFSPCRMCVIKGVRIPSSEVKTHYVPLCRDKFPGSHESYDASALPLRDHASFMEQAKEVEDAPTDTNHQDLALEYGIKGVPLLSVLSSLSFPTSFPYDFMHLIWINLIPNLVRLWTGKFKDLSHGGEGYVLTKTVWEAIGEATAGAGKTIPAAFGSRVPNLALEKAQMTAETYSIWTLYIAPTLLKGRFVHTRYYDHFVKLIRLLSLCIDWEITQDQVDEIDKGFQSWVQTYEW